MELASPFRDRELVAFLMAIPGDVVNCRGAGRVREATIGLLPEPIRTRRWKADFTFMFKRGALVDYGLHQRVADARFHGRRRRFVDSGLEDRIAIRAVVAQDDDLAVPTWRVTTLAALELWLRHFFRRRSDMYDLQQHDAQEEAGRPHARALERLAVPGSVVLNIGTGVILALLGVPGRRTRSTRSKPAASPWRREAAAANGFRQSNSFHPG